MAEPLKIDSHIHLYKTSEEGNAAKEGYQIWEYGQRAAPVHSSRYSGTIEDALEAMKSAGISKAVVVHLFSALGTREEAIARLPEGLGQDDKDRAIREIDAGLPYLLKEFNRWGCDIVKDHPQLVSYITADAIALPGEEGVAHIRDMVENHGARGIKMHGAVQGFSMSDERMWPVYGACREMGLPIICHSGPDRGGAHYAEPRAFGRMLGEFPDLKVVLAHMGGGTWHQAAEIAQTYPNAYFDCCEIIEWTGGTDAPTDQQLARLISDIGPERVMMGSDFPWYDLDHSVERVMELPILSQEEKEGILGANAVDILGL
ncbi:MAG: amidohydrolase [Chloroflexi bacterium]|nr:amidohydrolase [Chloroflexota bacterium]